MTFIKHNILSGFANIIGTKRLIRKTNQNLINVFYHSVSNNYIPHISPIYKLKSVDEFRSDIKFILKHFNPVSASEILENQTKSKPFKKPSVHISFDDGLKEVYSEIFPILKSEGIPATIFVNSDFVDNKQLFYRYKMALIIDKIEKEGLDSSTEIQLQDILSDLGFENNDIKKSLFSINFNQKLVLDQLADIINLDFDNYLATKTPYLTTSQIKEMQNSGFTVGAHSKNHPDYSDIDAQEQVYQTKSSIDYVRENFLEKKMFFAFPFSDFGVDSETIQKIHDFVDLSFGISGIKTEYNGQHLQRIDMEKGGFNAKSLINRAYFVNYLKKNNR